MRGNSVAPPYSATNATLQDTLKGKFKEAVGAGSRQRSTEGVPEVALLGALDACDWNAGKDGGSASDWVAMLQNVLSLDASDLNDGVSGCDSQERSSPPPLLRSSHPHILTSPPQLLRSNAYNALPFSTYAHVC